MNTQGMSYGEGKGEGRTLQEQRDAIPPLQVREMNLISDALKVELKQLINEVLDERELRELDDESDEWLYSCLLYTSDAADE